MVGFWREAAWLFSEVDGIGPHSTPRALASDRDRERQNAPLSLFPQVRIVQFTRADLRWPGYVLAVVWGRVSSCLLGATSDG